MAACGAQLQTITGTSTGVFSNAEGGFRYNREDTPGGTTPIPIPTTTGTNYSWYKWLCLAVTASGTTNMSNRRIQLASTETAGLGIFFGTTGAYVQAASGNLQASAASNGPATPAASGSITFSRATSALQVYDNNSSATSSTGRNGLFLQTALGVDLAASAIGAGNAQPLPNLSLVYDEQAAPEGLLRDAVAWARDPLTTSLRHDRHCRRRGRAERF